MQLVSGQRYRFTDTVDQRRPFVRLTGRDQGGGEFEAEIYGPGRAGYERLGGPGSPGIGGQPGEVGDRRVGDAALGDLNNTMRSEGVVQISALAAWQRALDQHYGRS